MAATAESSSSSLKNDKPVIVRVKRKAFQSRLDAFWLEINERPVKRPLLDFANLSIADSASKVEEVKAKKVFVQHVETVASSELSADILRSFVDDTTDSQDRSRKIEERRRAFRTESKQDQLLVKAKQRQEISAKNARFEQIWRSRKEKKEVMHDEALNEMCRLYDIVRVDTEEKVQEEPEKEDVELGDHRMMCQFLPLLREVIPSAAAEVESDISNYISRRACSEDYVYDFYAVKNDSIIAEKVAVHSFPLVQVDDDDDYYDGPDDSEYETDDSNAENNPMNEYPDEESSEDVDEAESRTSDDGSETESRSSGDQSEQGCGRRASARVEERQESSGYHTISEDDMYSDDEMHGYHDGDVYDDDFGIDE